MYVIEAVANINGSVGACEGITFFSGILLDIIFQTKYKYSGKDYPIK